MDSRNVLGVDSSRFTNGMDGRRGGGETQGSSVFDLSNQGTPSWWSGRKTDGKPAWKQEGLCFGWSSLGHLSDIKRRHQVML